MKKTVVALLVAFVVGSVHGGSVNWNITNLGTAGGGGSMVGTSLANGLVYGFVGSSSDASAASIAAQGGATTWTAFLSGYVNPQLGTALTSGGFATLSGQGAFANQSVSVFLVAFDASTEAAAGNYLVTATYSQAFGAIGNKTYAFGVPGGTYVPSNWSPVPEPCSMALFGIGAAAIGLRRRFAKKS